MRKLSLLLRQRRRYCGRDIQISRPDPVVPLFGHSAEETAAIDTWNRRIEIGGIMPTLHAVRNHLPNFKGRVIPGTRSELPQLPAMVERGQDMLKVLLGASTRNSRNRSSARDRRSASPTTPDSS